MNRKMPAHIIGITGGIGSGKSVVCRILALRGFTVYDCDSRAKSLMVSDPMASAIADIVGSEAFTPDGSLNRRYVAERIFSDDSARRKVNEVVHRGVKEDIERTARSCGQQLFFVESAILATSGLDDLTSVIWLVEAPVEIRLERAMARNKDADLDDTLRRIETQNQEYQLLRENDLRRIDNSGLVPLIPQIDALLEELND